MYKYLHVFFVGNQLTNCRNHILEFKESILRLKNKTERNRQELLNAFKEMKLDISEKEHDAKNAGLHCFCFVCGGLLCNLLCLEILILCCLILGHFFPVDITKSVLIFFYYETCKSVVRGITDKFLLTCTSKMVLFYFLSLNGTTIRDPSDRSSQKPAHPL